MTRTAPCDGHVLETVDLAGVREVSFCPDEYAVIGHVRDWATEPYFGDNGFGAADYAEPAIYSSVSLRFVRKGEPLIKEV